MKRLTQLILGAVMALCLGVLVGCASAPSAAKPSVELASSARADRAIVAATLAKVGTCEVDVAADYTAIILNYQLASNAAAAASGRLKIGVITIDQARQAQARTNAVHASLTGARIDLGAACPNDKATLNATHHAAAKAKIKDAVDALTRSQP